MTKKRFVVCDEQGATSWSDKTEASEAFATFAGAQTRAEELAKTVPGETIRIYELVAETTVATTPVATRRLKRS